MASKLAGQLHELATLCEGKRWDWVKQWATGDRVGRLKSELKAAGIAVGGASRISSLSGGSATEVTFTTKTNPEATSVWEALKKAAGSGSKVQKLPAGTVVSTKKDKAVFAVSIEKGPLLERTWRITASPKGS